MADNEATNSRLLALPTELRDLIYDFALVSPEEVRVDRENWSLPALLGVNHQVRTEASAIYFRDNTFEVDCLDFDSKVLHAFWRRGNRYAQYTDALRGYRMKLFIILGNRQRPTPSSWTNLLGWIKASRSRSLPDLPPAENIDVAVKMFSVARKLEMLEWSQVVEVLEDVKAISESDGFQWT